MRLCHFHHFRLYRQNQPNQQMLLRHRHHRQYWVMPSQQHHWNLATDLQMACCLRLLRRLNLAHRRQTHRFHQMHHQQLIHHQAHRLCW